MSTHSKGKMSGRIHQTNIGCLKRERIGIVWMSEEKVALVR